MSFRKPYHMPFRKLIRPFTLTGYTMDISSKYKSEDEFCSIIGLDILRWLHDGCFSVEVPSCENIQTSPSRVETSSKNRLRSV